MRRVLLLSLSFILVAALVAGALGLRHKRLQELAA